MCKVITQLYFKGFYSKLNYILKLMKIILFCVTVSIRIVADFGLHSCQVTRKLERATTLAFTTEPAIIFIHCCMPFILHLKIIGTKM